MVILGISAFGHDAAAAVLVDGHILAACEEERLSRVKHDGSFPGRSIAYCLKTAGVREEDVDYVAFYHNPWLHMGRRLWHAFAHLPRSMMFLKSHGTDIQDWGAMFGVRKRFSRARFVYAEHHLAHAASAFYPSPFREAAILSVDGMGEWDTTLFALGRDREIIKLDSVCFPHSLGIYYEAFTQYLGFRIHSDEYKVMGLSAYGSDRYCEAFKSIIAFNGGGRFKLDLDMFEHQIGSVPFYSSKLERKFGPPRDKGDPLESRHADIAFACQQTLEHALLRLVGALAKATGVSNLCIAGGVGLNCVANGRLLDGSPFSRIFVQPASYDSGCAIGCCYYVFHHLLGNRRSEAVAHFNLGPGFRNASVEEALRTTGVQYKVADDPGVECARMLASGKVVGWFQGRMEFGPRALGARSILADPTRLETRRKVSDIKRREQWRPFAPSVLQERAREYFTITGPSPYMLFVRNVRVNKRDVIPSVTHVDGTSRLQTVASDVNPRFYQLISEFERLTGVPVLLNTSLNLKREPIACTPEDALGVFARSELDALFLENYYVRRS